MSESFDLNAILGQAMEMQQQLLAAQAQAAEAEITGSAGGGAVEVTVTGGMDFRQVTIRPDAVDPDDVAMLEDLVLAALNDAMNQIGEMQQSSLGGLDLGGLGGIGGLGGPEGPAGTGPGGGFSLEALMGSEPVEAEVVETGDDEPGPTDRS
ncbi:MAG: YbaB/EbfC family nucleoid-associated protein [Acidimicrobiales bacterium]|jgi:DNA-binding YbaB/EbfC family protein|nr:YbaB/EbfC family nucleoid-associated protein [Acidimicrobiales bacterium]